MIITVEYSIKTARFHSFNAHGHDNIEITTTITAAPIPPVWRRSMPHEYSISFETRIPNWIDFIRWLMKLMVCFDLLTSKRLKGSEHGALVKARPFRWAMRHRWRLRVALTLRFDFTAARATRAHSTVLDLFINYSMFNGFIQSQSPAPMNRCRNTPEMFTFMCI